MRKKDPLKTIFIYLCTLQKQARKLTCFLSNIMYTYENFSNNENNIMQVNFVFLLQPYEKGWFAAINFPTRKLSRTSQNFLAWE